jgi:NADPH-dependent curcumin reductase CurA
MIDTGIIHAAPFGHGSSITYGPPLAQNPPIWLADGSLRCAEEILDGIDRYPEALQFMFNGGNTGKLLVKIS